MAPLPAARMVSLALCAMGALAIGYACVAELDVVVSLQGRVIPSGKSKTVQPMEAGIVRAIAVRDGQHVKAGEVLLELDATSSTADRDRLQREFWEAEAETARVGALQAGTARLELADGMPPEIAANQRAVLASRLAEQQARLATLDADIARRQADQNAIAAGIAQLRASLPLVEKKHAMREELAQGGHVAQAGVIETRLELMNLEKELLVQSMRLKEAQAGTHAAVRQRAQLQSEFQARSSAELVEGVKKRDALRQELVKAGQRQQLQVLRAPIDGIVQQLAVSTVGGVVTQAQALMAIVPDNAPLEVEAQVQNRDVGHLRVGQGVVNKVETFDFTRFGAIAGEVQWVGTDAVVDPKLGPVYPVRIRLAAHRTPRAVNGMEGKVTAGMNVVADVRVDQRRMIEYFLAPLLRYQQEALRER